jgi:hypothetical protein
MSGAIRDDSALVIANAGEVQLGTLHATTPQTLVAGASIMASALADVISKQHLYVTIQGRDHVRVEGWTTLAVMLGCTAREVKNEEQGDGSFVAVVELVRMSDGVVLSRASSECGMDEPTWAARPRYARRSMAATRATGKACRLAFSWIMTLAGYDATPAEEMPVDARDVTSPKRVASDPSVHLADWLDAPLGFGKHKERSWRYMAQQHPDYLQWMIDKAKTENKSGPNTDKAAAALDWIIGMNAPKPEADAAFDAPAEEAPPLQDEIPF